MEPNQPQFSDKLLKQFNSSFDMKRLLGNVLSNWYWFALSIAVTLTSGFLYLRYTTPIYQINSSILIDEQRDNVGKNVLSKLDPEGSKSAVNLYNEMFILRSQDLIALVVDSLDMNIKYWAVGRIKETELYNDCPIRVVFDSAGYNNGNTTLIIKQVVEGQFEIQQEKITERVLYDTWVKRPYGRFKIVYRDGPEVNKGFLSSTEFIVRIENAAVTNNRVLGTFGVFESDGRTSLLDLSYTDNIPQRGVDFMNVLIHYYRRNELENLNRTAEKTREFINQRKTGMVEELKTMDSLAGDIRVSNDMIDPQAQTTAYMTEKTTSENRVNQILVQKQAINSLKNTLQNVPEGKSQVLAGIGVDDPFLTQLIGQYNQQVQRKEELERNYPSSNPFVLQAESDLAALRKRILDAADRVDRSLGMSLENAAKNAQEYTSRIKNAPLVDRNLRDVRRTYDALQNMFLYLYQKGVENEISVYSAVNKSKIVVVPYAAGTPIKPVHKTVYAMMFLLGILVPGTFFVVREMLNNKVINENDIESLTNIPIIGAVSRVDPDQVRENTIVVGPHIRTGIAEQFRLIRANLEFMSASKDNRVFMITSSTSGEGKSFVSINLGITMTLAKKRVVIMEFDLRKPKISQYLGLSNEGGISGYLAGLGELESVIKASGIHENLYIANCGPIPPNPGELLVSHKTQELIEELQEMFDVVIIDTAPIGMVSDALILSQFAGINLFLIRQSYTIKDQVKMFDVLHKDGKITNPAIIFNGVEYLRKYGYGYGGSGYGYSYGYGAGYGYGYYEEKPKTAKKKKSTLKGFFTK